MRREGICGRATPQGAARFTVEAQKRNNSVIRWSAPVGGSTASTGLPRVEPWGGAHNRGTTTTTITLARVGRKSEQSGRRCGPSVTILGGLPL